MFQRRVNGDVKFYRSLKRYKTGFGSIESGEYWLGKHTIKMNFKSSSYENIAVPWFLALTNFSRKLGFHDCGSCRYTCIILVLLTFNNFLSLFDTRMDTFHNMTLLFNSMTSI